jgi:hypothetical protein
MTIRYAPTETRQDQSVSQSVIHVMCPPPQAAEFLNPSHLTPLPAPPRNHDAVPYTYIL